MSQARAGDKTGKISDAGLAFPAQDPHHPGPLLPTTPSPLPGEEGEQPCSPPHGPADLKPSHGVCRPTPGTTHPACVGTTWTFLPTRVHTGWHARFQRRRPSHHPGYPPAPPVPTRGLQDCRPAGSRDDSHGYAFDVLLRTPWAVFGPKVRDP